MATTTVPSSSACVLYVEMALTAEDEHLSMLGTLDLAVDRVQRGYLTDTTEVGELISQGWIEHANDGGWNIRRH